MSPIFDADEAGLAAAAAALARGALVAIPTETVYGLGVDARQAKAVAALYAAKQRPRFNPLIAHVANAEAARREGVFTPAAQALAEAFWPGPMTLVVPSRPESQICDLARAGLPSLALRVPAHSIALALLTRCGFPVAAPSANRSGRISPTSAAHVLQDFPSGLAGILDGGPCAIGLESTIVRCDDQGATLLRPGGLKRASIEAVIGPLLLAGAEESVQAPGQLASHYAPRAAVRLNALSAAAGEVLLGFGAIDGDLNLSPSGDLAEAAAKLFQSLRVLDARGVGIIAVAPIPEIGLGEAIMDRLRRAAAPRLPISS